MIQPSGPMTAPSAQSLPSHCTRTVLSLVLATTGRNNLMTLGPFRTRSPPNWACADAVQVSAATIAAANTVCFQRIAIGLLGYGSGYGSCRCCQVGRQ